jgi:hypothetical protein
MGLPLPDDRCLRLGTDISRSFGLPLLLTMSLMMGPLAGCANPGPTSPSDIIPVICANSVVEDTALLDWELTVRTLPIESGELFTATLDGVAVFNETFLDAAQDVVEGGVKEVNLVDLNATVHVRSGATGADVILTIEPIPYKCDEDRTECDPANDDVTGVPGRRSNTDCQPEETTNPCGRFVLVPSSTDCASGGVCADLRKTGPSSQCERNGFCLTGDLRIELERASGDYTADSQGEVLFGWADESTGATIEEMPIFADPTGPIGLRVGIGPLLVALECTMGVDTPDSALISFPIETP